MSLSFDRTYLIALSLTVLTMLLMPRMIGASVIILIIVFLVGIWKRKMQFQISVMGISFILLYLIYFIGWTYSDDPVKGLKFLEYKLSFLVFPLIFMWKCKTILNWSWLYITFLSSLVVLWIAGLIHGSNALGEFSVMDSFTSSRFSFVHHPTYLSIFALFGIELIRSKRVDVQGPKLRILIVSVLVLIQLHCMSLAGFIFLFVYFLVISASYITKRFGMKWALAIGGTLVLFSFLIISIVPPVRLQVQTAWNSFELYQKDPKGFVRSRQTYVTGNETRLIMWTASYYAIKEHPFGVGTGSADLSLERQLRDLKQSEAFIQKHYDPHNQFLMTWLEIGVLGFLLLFFILGYSIVYGWKIRDSLLILLGSSLLFQSLFESILQRQSGIVFFTFWFCFLMSYANIERSKKVVELT